jgi:hypothetical protein
VLVFLPHRASAFPLLSIYVQCCGTPSDFTFLAARFLRHFLGSLTTTMEHLCHLPGQLSPLLSHSLISGGAQHLTKHFVEHKAEAASSQSVVPTDRSRSALTAPLLQKKLWAAAITVAPPRLCQCCLSVPVTLPHRGWHQSSQPQPDRSTGMLWRNLRWVTSNLMT